MRVEGTRFGFQFPVSRFQVLGFEGTWLRVQDPGFRVLGIRDSGFGLIFRDQVSSFMHQGSGFKVPCLRD